MNRVGTGHSRHSFASYYSKTEISGAVIRYTRTFEVKEWSLPVDRANHRANDHKRFDRAITSDERSTVVLKAVAH
jgi:hypothetical protein